MIRSCIGRFAFLAMVLLGCSVQTERAADAATTVFTGTIAYAPVKGYIFTQSPAAYSMAPQTGLLAALPPPSADSLLLALTDSITLTADDAPPIDEDAPFFVVTTDSAFQAMVCYGMPPCNEPVQYDSALAPVDFRKEFLVVLYAPPVSLTEASATLAVNAVAPDDGVLYVSTSSLYSAPQDSLRKDSLLWQVVMYKVEKHDFHRVGIVAEDTTYFGL